jgi:hypothetical protein
MKRTYLACLALAGVLLSSGAARAGIIQDFQFGDANGTVITAAANSASPGNNFLSQNTAINAGVQSGSFRIQKGGEITPVTGQVSNTFDIANVTSGKVWLVADIAGWNYTATASSPSERLRFGFLDNTDPVAAGSSTVTAEMTIDRLGNGLILSGETLGTGSTNIGPDYAMGLARSTPLRIVLELNKTTDQYSVYYREGAGAYSLLGTADLGASTLNAGDRDGNSVRFAFTGSFNDTGEFVDVDRIFVTDVNPIPEPVSTVLAFMATAGLALVRKRSS